MSLTTRMMLPVLLALAHALDIQPYHEVTLRAARDKTVRADTVITARAMSEGLERLDEDVRQAHNLLARDPGARALDPAPRTDGLHSASAAVLTSLCGR